MSVLPRRGDRRSLRWIVARLPRRVSYGLATRAGRRRYRRAALDGIVRCDVLSAVGIDERQSDVLVRRAFELAACDELEYVLLSRITPENLADYVELRGLDRLQGALEGARGAIVYSCHVRGHYLFFAALGALGLRPNVLGMPNDPDAPADRRRALERRDAVLRERFGCRFLYMGGDDPAVAVRAANALRSNQVVTMEIDHTHSDQNLKTRFLGRTAVFPVGPLLLARATGAPCVPFWLHRPPRMTPLVAELGEPIRVDEDLPGSLARLVAPLELNVRRHPESWATWMFPDFRLFTQEAA